MYMHVCNCTSTYVFLSLMPNILLKMNGAATILWHSWKRFHLSGKKLSSWLAETIRPLNSYSTATFMFIQIELSYADNADFTVSKCITHIYSFYVTMKTWVMKRFAHVQVSDRWIRAKGLQYHLLTFRWNCCTHLNVVTFTRCGIVCLRCLLPVQEPQHVLCIVWYSHYWWLSKDCFEKSHINYTQNSFEINGSMENTLKLITAYLGSQDVCDFMTCFFFQLIR